MRLPSMLVNTTGVVPPRVLAYRTIAHDFDTTDIAVMKVVQSFLLQALCPYVKCSL